MNTGEFLSRGAVRLAARLLPARMRDRYREQWLADLRDAEEVGIKPSEIALGSLAFAATLDRPVFVGFRSVPPEIVTRRSRLALGLSLSSALLALSHSSNLGYGGLTGNDAYDLLLNLITAGLLGFGASAPLGAALIVIITRGISARVRGAVALLVVASCAPLTRLIQHVDFNYLSPGAGASIGAAVLVVIACAVVWRPTRERSTLAPAAGLLAVLAFVGVVLSYAIVTWEARAPLVWGPLADPAYYAEWVELKVSFEQLVLSIFRLWAIVGASLALVVFLVGRLLRPRRALALGIAVLGVGLVSSSAMLSLLELGIGNSGVPYGISALDVSNPVRLAGQVIVVATTFIAVGGVRYLPRPGHRHDVEGTVELVERELPALDEAERKSRLAHSD